MNYLALLITILGAGTCFYFVLQYYLPFGREEGCGYIETVNVAQLRYHHRKLIVELTMSFALGVGLAWYMGTPLSIVCALAVVVVCILCVRGIPFRSQVKLARSNYLAGKFVREGIAHNIILNRVRKEKLCDTAIVFVVTLSFAVNTGSSVLYAATIVATTAWGLTGYYFRGYSHLKVRSGIYYTISVATVVMITGVKVEVILTMAIATIAYKVINRYLLQQYDQENKIYNEVRAFSLDWGADDDEAKAAQEPQRQFSLLKSHRELRAMIAAAKAYAKNMPKTK